MAPKRHGGGFDSAVVRGKRTVRRPARAPTPSVSSSSTSSTPSAAEGPSNQPIDTLAGKVITMGRKVDFDFFEREGFSIGRMIKNLKWDRICSLDVPTYPALVKEFYFNLSRGDGGIVSEVRGKRIHVTADILGNLLSIPVRNLHMDPPTEKAIALSRMLGREITDFEEIRANQLTLELRLLHNICGRILFPKIGRFEYVSERDILLMDSILCELQIDLAGMIIWYMAEAASKKRSTLPYGMVLTLVFESQGVVFSENEPKKNLRHTDYYSLGTIRRMGFVKRNGSWERKMTSEDRAASGPSAPREPSPVHIPESAPTDPLLPSTPIPSVIPSFTPSANVSDIQIDKIKSLLDSQNESLKAIFDSKIDEVKLEIKEEFNSRFLSLKEDLKSLEERISSVESSFSSSTSSLGTELKNIIEEIGNLGGDSKTYATCNAELQEKICAACAFMDERLRDFVKIQSEGMRKILDHCQIITRRI